MPPLRCSSTLPFASCVKQLGKVHHPPRSFSTTPQNAVPRRPTRARRAMYKWFDEIGKNFLEPLPNSTNYMGAYNSAGKLRRLAEGEAAKEQGKEDKDKNKAKANREEPAVEEKREEGEQMNNKDLPPETRKDYMVYPLNPSFISQPVLSEELKEEIWKRVMVEGLSVREVSAQLLVEMRRVGAVVRLKEVEKEWERTGKRLVRSYDESVMSMLPQTPFDPNQKPINHESINDLPVHRKTGQQIFHPTSESRHFTRADAAKVFDEKLLPADDRVPHPELAVMHKEYLEGLSGQEREARYNAREEAAKKKRDSAEARQARLDAAVKKVNTTRWEFRITDISVDDAGKDGRGLKGTGWRYGFPHMDRSRGQVKIPTSVE